MKKAVERVRREALAVVAARRELVTELVGAAQRPMEHLCTTYRSVVMGLDARTAVKFMRVAGVSDTDPLAVADDLDTDAFRMSATVAGFVTTSALRGDAFLAPEYVPVLVGGGAKIKQLAVRAAAVPMRRFATTLAAELVAHRWFSNDEVERLAARLRHAVQAAHRAGHQHGDLHPGQVLMDHDPGTAVVTDWCASCNTQPIGAARGPYDPPIDDGPITGMDADRWALGCMLVDALAGSAEAVCADVDAVASVVTGPERTRAIAARVWPDAAVTDAEWLGHALRGLVPAERIAERASGCASTIALARALLARGPCPGGLAPTTDEE